MKQETQGKEPVRFLLFTEDSRLEKRVRDTVKRHHHKVVVYKSSTRVRLDVMDDKVKFDVVLSDIDHTRAEGLTVLADVKKYRPHAKLFLLAAKKFETYVLEDAKTIGIHGTYLAKDLPALFREHGYYL